MKESIESAAATTVVKISDLQIHEPSYPRLGGLDQETVLKYMEGYSNPHQQINPIKTYRVNIDGKFLLFIGDGHHRTEACRRLQRDTIEAISDDLDIKEIPKNRPIPELLVSAMHENASHGLPLKTDDIRACCISLMQQGIKPEELLSFAHRSTLYKWKGEAGLDKEQAKQTHEKVRQAERLMGKEGLSLRKAAQKIGLPKSTLASLSKKSPNDFRDSKPKKPAKRLPDKQFEELYEQCRKLQKNDESAEQFIIEELLPLLSKKFLRVAEAAKGSLYLEQTLSMKQEINELRELLQSMSLANRQLQIELDAKNDEIAKQHAGCTSGCVHIKNAVIKEAERILDALVDDCEAHHIYAGALTDSQIASIERAAVKQNRRHVTLSRPAFQFISYLDMIRLKFDKFTPQMVKSYDRFMTVMMESDFFKVKKLFDRLNGEKNSEPMKEVINRVIMRSKENTSAN